VYTFSCRWITIEILGEGGEIQDRVPGSQKSKTEAMRIVVADSRDLAYEYSKSILEFDMKSGEHVSFDSPSLAKGGRNLEGVAAVFMRPYDK
jgi:hypothetical protein